MSSEQQPIRGTTAPAAPEPAAYRQRPHGYDDEISLRELYLILKRGLPLILASAALAALAAAAFLWSRPPVYESETTVVSSPTAVQLQGEGTLRFEPNNVIPFATYEDLATSRATMEATLESLGEEAAAVGGFRSLQAASELERLTGPANANDMSPLTVAHRVRWEDAEAAARFADAWAATTVEQVRSTLLANLDIARENTTTTISSRQRALAEAEEDWREFLQTDASGLQMRLTGLEARITEMDARLAGLDREVAVATGRREVLLAQLGSSSDEISDDVLAVLEGNGSLEPEVASRLRLLATDVPPGSGIAADAAELLARTDLQRESVELAGLLHERSHVETSQERYEEQAEDLRARLAELRTRESRVERRLETARNAYDAVAAIEPVLAFVADLTPGNTRILNAAQVPAGPTGPSATLVMIIAALVTAMAATVFVFLREAVREPGPRG